MSEYIQVKYSDVDNVGEALDAATKSMATMLADLDQNLQALRASWTGAAEQEYTIAKGKWDGAIAEMNAILTRSRGVLEDMSYNYRATDLNLAMRWADIG